MIEALTHLFGSVDGYRTLARSPGLTDAEEAALAALGFGSPQRAEEFDDLERSPCMAGRLLPSGRYAITRMFKAGLDVAGRQTVERRTIVLSGEQWARISALDLQAILASDETWSRRPFEEGRGVRVPETASDDLLPAAEETDRRAYDALLSAQESGRCAMLPDDPRFRAAVLRLPRLLPSAEALCLGWGVGLWSIPTGVWLATIREPGRQRNAFTAATAGAWRHPERLQTLGGGAPRAATPTRFASPLGLRPDRSRLLVIVPSAATVLLLLLAVLLWPRGTQPQEDAPTPGVPAASTAPAAPTPQLSEAPPAPSAPSGPGTSPTPPLSARDDERPGFGATPSSSAGFGQAAPTSEGAGGGGATVPVPPPSAPNPPPAVPVTPGPAPAAPPSAPAVPVAPDPESTPWDDELRSLQESVDLVHAITEACRTTAEPGDALLAQAQELVQRCDALCRQANKRSNDDPRRERLLNLDAAGGGGALAEDLLAVTATDPVPPELVRRLALLAARFQMRVAASAIERSMKLHPSVRATREWTKVLNALDEVSDWPKPPFQMWVVAGARTKGSLSTVVAARLVDGCLARDLPKHSGMRPFIEALKRAESLLPSEAAP